jgi:hypothetical protein
MPLMNTHPIPAHQYHGALLYTPNYIIPLESTISYHQPQQRVQHQLQVRQVQQPQQSHWPSTTPSLPRISGEPWAYMGSTSSALGIVFCPRPFEEIHTEQRLLLDQLNQRNDYAIKQLREWAFGEEALTIIDGAEEHEANKNRHGLQGRIAVIMEWEKGILRRISELHLEIQCRERWCQVQQEMIERRAGVRKGLGRCDDLSRHPLSSHRSPTGPLPHLTSTPAHGPPVYESVRSGLTFNSDNFARQWGHQHGQHGHDGGYQDAKSVAELPAPHETAGWAIREPNVEWKQDEETEEASDSGPTSTENITCTQPTRKRMSLPSLQYAWADTTDTGDEGHKCLGYTTDE